MKRRQFVKGTGSGLSVLGLSGLFWGCSDAGGLEDGEGGAGNQDELGYGPLLQKDGQLLALPEGFRYVVFGAVGTKMSDGNTTPGNHDGMAVFPVDGKKNRVRLVRNHEIGGVGEAVVAGPLTYDPKGTGSVSIVEWDTVSEKVIESFIVLSGTIENCSGGANWKQRWWLSCEENTDGTADGYDEDHGYVFAVPVDATGLVKAVPLKAMGRFLHEAAVTDPDTGFVYMTEDEGPDSLYRFVPDDDKDLSAGGSLWALKIRGTDNFDTGAGQTVGEVLEVEWVEIEEPDPENPKDPARVVFDQGQEKGAALFQGLEGAYFQDGSVYFTASDGGEEELGQIWKLTPSSMDEGELVLVFESQGGEQLDGPDNLCVSPNGKALVICEDGDGEGWIDGDDSCKIGGDTFLRVVTQDGKIFDLAKVIEPLDLVKYFADDFEEDCTAMPLPKAGEVFGVSELTGAGFSPDGKWLFVNLQYPGATLAITGPWEAGVLGS